jgi:hypothetical protein
MPHLRKTRVSGQGVHWVLILETICNVGFFLRNQSCAAVITGIPPCYVVGGSDTGNVSRDRFSHKRNANVGRAVTDNPFWLRENILTDEKWTINMRWQTNDNLRRMHFRLNCRQVIWIIVSNIQQYKWRWASTWRWLEVIKHWWVGRGKNSSSFSSESPHRKHSQNLLAGCYCSLFVRSILL